MNVRNNHILHYISAFVYLFFSFMFCFSTFFHLLCFNHQYFYISTFLFFIYLSFNHQYTDHYIALKSINKISNLIYAHNSTRQLYYIARNNTHCLALSLCEINILLLMLEILKCCYANQPKINSQCLYSRLVNLVIQKNIYAISCQHVDIIYFYKIIFYHPETQLKEKTPSCSLRLTKI